MKIFLFLSFFILTSACSRLSTVGSKTSELIDNIGCKTSKSRMFDVLLAGLDENGQILDRLELEPLIEARIQKTWKTKLTYDQSQNLKETLLNFYFEINSILKSEKRATILQESLAAFELGVKDGVEYGAYTDRVSQKINKLTELTKNLDLPCDEDETNPPIENENQSPVSYGSTFSLAVAYQSCEALSKEPMSENTESVRGIQITGTHASGGGKKRIIASLPQVQDSHYYLKDIKYEKNCLAVSQSPLIYDYGGKPFFKTSEPKNLDFFKNAGSGTEALGIDCSGFIFSSIASGGARLSSTTEMKASLVMGIPARAYMNPSNNGMNCIEPAKLGYTKGTLQAGDIVASAGHIFIVEQVGDDPLGFGGFTNINQCDTLTYKKFDFLISQSSPTKGGIGISRSYAQSYLRETGSFRVALEHYAKENCRAHFLKTDPTITHSKVKIVRHKNIPQCRTQSFTLKNQACVASCFQ